MRATPLKSERLLLLTMIITIIMIILLILILILILILTLINTTEAGLIFVKLGARANQANDFAVSPRL